ncbi:hypothetical protein BH11ACT8_BH11ACT8_24040 [soil metagenome]
MRPVVLTAALLGGMVWVADLFVDRVALSVTGAVLLGASVLFWGAGLVRQAWLAAITGAGAVILAWSILSLLRDAADDRVLEGVLGGLASLLVAVGVARGPREARASATGRTAGNHRG